MKIIKHFPGRQYWVLALALTFFLSDGAGIPGLLDLPFSSTALAKSEKSSKSDKDDGGGGVCDEGNWIYDQSACSWTLSCSSLDKLQIDYDKHFIDGSPVGPNIKVTGVDSTDCTVDINKISGNENCAFKVKASDSKLKIDTKREHGQSDCAMTIEVTIPRTMSIA
ncbi:hypothetical protein UR09_06025, partial [Candidatus Nitromaritima sp. SCGC AAA799-A02]